MAFCACCIDAEEDLELHDWDGRKVWLCPRCRGEGLDLRKCELAFVERNRVHTSPAQAIAAKRGAA